MAHEGNYCHRRCHTHSNRELKAYWMHRRLGPSSSLRETDPLSRRLHWYARRGEHLTSQLALEPGEPSLKEAGSGSAAPQTGSGA